MSAVQIVSMTLIGTLLGHGMRRALPSWIRLKDRRLPFRGPWLEIGTGALFAVTAWRWSDAGLTHSWLSPWPIYLWVLGLTAFCSRRGGGSRPACSA